MDKEAAKYVWEGKIPMEIHLHESEILAPRIGYLPLLVPLIKPYFSNTLPPGADAVWFEYKGLPLKWYIPTGVLFDLLCAEPERPWNLTVHFRGYPGDILIPCEGEDSVKWSFINSLKEAAYITNGNCKNIMNMSQSDQADLWRSVMDGNLEAYLTVASKLKLGNIEDEYSTSYPAKSGQNQDADQAGLAKTGRIPVRLYVRNLDEDFADLEDFPEIETWDKVSYINKPVGFFKEGGRYFTLRDAIRTLLPHLFGEETTVDEEQGEILGDEELQPSEEDKSSESAKCDAKDSDKQMDPVCILENAKIKLIRIQGIEPKLEIPFSWVVNNLMNPEHFLHICVYVKASECRHSS